MDFSLLFLIAAFGGGIFGTAIGGQPAFIFTGFMVMIGVANSLAGGQFDFLTNVAFGPVFGPHISFAGAAAAAAFAANRGSLETARDIGTPLTGTRDPLVFVVGGLFGMGGYLVNFGLGSLLSIAGTTGGAPVPLTDTVALTVGISGIAARLIFGSSGLFGTMDAEDRERGRFVPGGTKVWVEHQQNLLVSTMLGAGRRPVIWLRGRNIHRGGGSVRRRCGNSDVRGFGGLFAHAPIRPPRTGDAPYVAAGGGGSGRGLVDRFGWRHGAYSGGCGRCTGSAPGRVLFQVIHNTR